MRGSSGRCPTPRFGLPAKVPHRRLDLRSEGSVLADHRRQWSRSTRRSADGVALLICPREFAIKRSRLELFADDWVLLKSSTPAFAHR